MTEQVKPRDAFVLDATQRALLRKRFEQAVRRARRRRSAGVLAAITVPVLSLIHISEPTRPY